jgi:hypothetical protein
MEASRARGGRPTVLTPEIQDLLCQAIRDGNYREVAAEWVGVSTRTLSRWMTDGKRKPDTVYGRFRRAVLEAERCAEMKMVEAVMRAAASDPKHAQWWLERKFPERWAANRIELRELKGRVEELEKNRVPAPRPEKKTRPDTPGGADKPIVVEPIDPDE